MIRLMIADDEKRIVKLISHLIDFERLGIELAGCAYDGLSALELLQKEHPQIALVDIKMPGIDGIELIRRARELGIDTHFVILSGYGSFDYAQSAIHFQVDDYLLKPVSKEALNDTLERLCSTVAAQEQKQGETEKMNEKLESNSERLHTYFMSNLIYNVVEIDNHTMIETNSLYNLAFQEGKYQVAILNIISKSPEAKLTLLIHQAQSYFQAAIGPKCYECQSIIDKDRVVIAMNYGNELTERMQGILKYTFENFCADDKFASFFHATFILGPVEDSLLDLHHSYSSAERSANLGIICGTDACYPAAPGIVQDLSISNEEIGLLKRAWLENNRDMICHLIDRMTKKRYEALKDNPSQMDDVLLILNKVEEFLDLSSSSFEEIRSRTMLEYRHCNNMKEVTELIVKAIDEMHEAYEEARSNSQGVQIAAAKKYIAEHYNEDITLEEVAQEAYLSPAYFSTLFKKEEGVNFSNYIMNYRVEMSKEMLKDPKYSIAEIAEKVGYPDQRYFSRIFKRVVGIVPAEYRKLASSGLLN